MEMAVCLPPCYELCVLRVTGSCSFRRGIVRAGVHVSCYLWLCVRLQSARMMCEIYSHSFIYSFNRFQFSSSPPPPFRCSGEAALLFAHFHHTIFCILNHKSWVGTCVGLWRERAREREREREREAPVISHGSESVVRWSYNQACSRPWRLTATINTDFN